MLLFVLLLTLILGLAFSLGLLTPDTAWIARLFGSDILARQVCAMPVYYRIGPLVCELSSVGEFVYPSICSEQRGYRLLSAASQGLMLASQKVIHVAFETGELWKRIRLQNVLPAKSQNWATRADEGHQAGRGSVACRLISQKFVR